MFPVPLPGRRSLGALFLLLLPVLLSTGVSAGIALPEGSDACTEEEIGALIDALYEGGEEILPRRTIPPDLIYPYEAPLWAVIVSRIYRMDYVQVPVKAGRVGEIILQEGSGKSMGREERFRFLGLGDADLEIAGEITMAVNRRTHWRAESAGGGVLPRIRAVEELVSRGCRGAAGEMARLLPEVSHHLLQRALTVALALLDPAEGLAFFPRQKGAREVQFRMNAVEALSLIEGAEASAAIASFYDDESWNVRLSVYAAMERRFDDEIWNLVVEMLDSRDIFENLAAVTAIGVAVRRGDLGQDRTEEAREILEDLSEDGRDLAAIEAAGILREIEAPGD